MPAVDRKKAKGAQVLVLLTGGVVGLVADNEDGAASLRPVPSEQFKHLVCDVDETTLLVREGSGLAVPVKIEVEDLRYENGVLLEAEKLDSALVDPKRWARIAKAIQDSYDRYDGFVVLHGLDTMAYTAAALSFML